MAKKLKIKLNGYSDCELEIGRIQYDSDYLNAVGELLSFDRIVRLARNAKLLCGRNDFLYLGYVDYDYNKSTYILCTNKDYSAFLNRIRENKERNSRKKEEERERKQLIKDISEALKDLPTAELLAVKKQIEQVRSTGR